MRILVTNDDGINAEGLIVLEDIARTISDDVWVVAPEAEQSGASRSLSLSDPLRMRQIDERRFAVKGTPTDCVLMAVHKIMPERPDLVLSGVNRGHNIADDVTYSGTIAAAMEGAVLGIRSIAVSQAQGIVNQDPISYEPTIIKGPQVISDLAQIEMGPGCLLNVNFPDCAIEDIAGVEATRQGKRDQNNFEIAEREDGWGKPYYWFGFRRERSDPAVGTDLWAVYNNYISVTPLHLNLTHVEGLDTLRNALTGE
ncbi:MAG TPA: 5'/3'-nucleotidase SurE [Rhizobiales bacterium]|nr:5'/3'-nucleotidase SurE [Hyphomicrobiales bacterium]